MSDDYFEKLRSDQYVDSSNLNARAALHDLFSVNRRGLHPWEFDYLLEAADTQIFELGCGPAYLWKRNLGRVPGHWKVVLSDISPGMLSEARDRTQPLSASFNYVVLDGQRLPFGNARFDTVMAHHILYHLPDIDSGISEIARVLKSSGLLLAATNGDKHLKEIRDLVHSLSDEIVFGSRDACASSSALFMKENGASFLDAHFEEVKWIDYEDALVITDPLPLENYILSFPGNASEVFGGKSMRLKLREAILGQMSKTGEFKVTKSTGMFIAKMDGA